MGRILKIAVLMTVFNRRQNTITCLSNLEQLKEIEQLFQLDIYLVDDGSTDGTSEAIKIKFPSVNIINGNGSLFWNRGMYTAWKATYPNAFDAFLWLNDDTFLFSNALEVLIKSMTQTNYRSIICGSICSPANKNEITYGGCKITNNDYKINYPSGQLEECDIINGNCVLIPNEVFQLVGNLDWTFRHAIGDNDYSLRAKKLGINSYTTGIFIGTCSKNASLPLWCRPDVNLIKRIKSLYSPLGNSEPIPYFKFVKRHFGVFTALKNLATIHTRLLFPWLWK